MRRAQLSDAPVSTAPPTWGLAHGPPPKTERRRGADPEDQPRRPVGARLSRGLLRDAERPSRRSSDTRQLSVLPVIYNKKALGCRLPYGVPKTFSE
jgi:hypothetical protein